MSGENDGSVEQANVGIRARESFIKNARYSHRDICLTNCEGSHALEKGEGSKAVESAIAFYVNLGKAVAG